MAATSSPLPRCWSSRDKHPCITLSQNNLQAKGSFTVRADKPIPKRNNYYYESRIVQIGTKQTIKFGYCSNSNIVEFHGNRLMTGELKSGDTIGCRLKRIRISEFDYYFVDYTKNGFPIGSRVLLEKYPVVFAKQMKIYPIISFNSPGLILSTDLGTIDYYLANGNVYLMARLK